LPGGGTELCDPADDLYPRLIAGRPRRRPLAQPRRPPFGAAGRKGTVPKSRRKPKAVY